MDGAEQAINRQTALFSLKLLCRSFGSDHQEAFVPVLLRTMELVAAAEEEKNVTGSALLCIAEVVSTLKALAIPQLPRSVVPVLHPHTPRWGSRRSADACLFPQVDASHTARAPKQEGASDQRDLPAERRHCPAAGRRDAATLHQPIPARRHLTGNAAPRALHQKNKGYKGLRWSCALIGSCCALFLAPHFFSSRCRCCFEETC